MKKHNRHPLRRALAVLLALAAVLLCLGLGGCKQSTREITVRSAWGGGSLTLRLAAAKPEANEAGTRVEFYSQLNIDEIAEAIVNDLPENTMLERHGSNILLRKTEGDGTLTDFYFLTMENTLFAESQKDGDRVVETVRQSRKGSLYVLNCMEREFSSADGNSVKMLFPLHFFANLEARTGTEPFPMDTDITYTEIAYRELLEFYDDFGRYNILMVDGVMVVNGYKNLPEGVDELQLAPMGQRVYLKVHGLGKDFKIQVSFKPGVAETEE